MLKYFLAFCLLVSTSFLSADSDVGSYLLTEKRNNVVMLTPPSNYTTGGTGFELKSPSGKVYTVTNRHICEMAENFMLSARVGNQGRPMLIRVIEMAPDTDLCIAEGLPYANGFSLADEFDDSKRLYVIGHPYLQPLTEAEGYTLGRETVHLFEETTKDKCVRMNQEWRSMPGPWGQADGCDTHVDAYNTSILIYPGNSGSPVLTRDGDVVGVAFASSGYTHFGSIIPFDVLKQFISFYR